MNCDVAQDQMVLLMYGELEDELAIGLEQHLDECDACQGELSAMREMDEDLAMLPVLEVSPNLLAQSRMRLDEALDDESPHGMVTRLRANFWRWTGVLTGAPALATLLVGVGFLGGDLVSRYRAAQMPKPRPGPVIVSEQTKGVITSVSGIVRTPDSELVQVKYTKLVPETVEGSLDDPQIRQLLMTGMRTGTSEVVRTDAVALLANECRLGHACLDGDDSKDVRGALMVRLRYDSDAGVRMKALHGLEPYVDQDQRVRDAVLEALMRDKNANVRKAAIGMLTPVQSDSSVRQVLRTVSTQDDNPYIRNASYEALQGAADIQ